MKRLLALLFILFAAAPAWSQVVFDAKGTALCVGTTGVATCGTLTVGSGANRALVVYLVFHSSAGGVVFHVTWNSSQTVPLVGSITYSASAAGGVALFCLANPASGKNNLAVSVTSGITAEAYAIATSWTGVDQTTPCANGANVTDFAAGVSTPAAVVVTSAPNHWATAVFSQNEAYDNSTNGTTIIIDDTNNTGVVANRIAGASPNVTLTATPSGSVPYQIAGIDIQPAVTASSCPLGMPLRHAGC